MTEKAPRRCPWAKSPAMIAYHDAEWGVPVHDDRILFEFLTLEGAQAGLSWETVLRKRERYRKVFHEFDPQRVARMTPKAIDRILGDPGIIRNRAKIESAIGNARALQAAREEFGSFDSYVWRFVDGRPVVNRWRRMTQVPATSKASDTMSKELRRRGFRFVGPTICYAFMQAVGMVNDHLVDCAWHDRVLR
jgi:DNA-3-methyladenine glycosylase I